MIHKRVFICFILLVVVLSACDTKTAERSNGNTMDIKRIINYAAPVPESKSSMPFKDMKKVEKLIGQGVERNVGGEDRYRLYDYGSGYLYVFYNDDKSRDYSSIIFAVASEKNPKEINFDSLKVGESTIMDVEKIDPVTKKSLITEDSPKKFYTIHLTKEGVVCIYYNIDNGKYYVSGIGNQFEFTRLTNEIKSDDLIS